VKILAQSRETIRQVIKLPLYGLTEEEASQESFFDHALECMDTALTNMVGRSVSIYPEGEDGGSRSMSGMGGMSGSRASLGASLGASLSSGSRGSRGGSRGALGAVPFLGVNPNDGTPLMYVSYVIDFLPLKPFKAPCELIISKASGGRWRHSVLLESTEPEVDDVIVIEGKKAKKKDWAKKGCTDFFYFSHNSRSPVEQHQQCVVQIDQSVRGLRPLHGHIHPRFTLRIHLLPQRGCLGTTQQR
jgi:hypothetical protein